MEQTCLIWFNAILFHYFGTFLLPKDKAVDYQIQAAMASYGSKPALFPLSLGLELPL